MEKCLPNFTEEVVKKILAATYVATFADRVALMETLQRHKPRRTSLCSCNIWSTVTRHCSPTNRAARVAITHPANEFKSIHTLHKNINAVAMLTGDALLRHFREGIYHVAIGSCALLSLMYSWLNLSHVSLHPEVRESEMRSLEV